MKAKLLLFALFTFLLLPTLALAGEAAAAQTDAATTNPAAAVTAPASSVTLAPLAASDCAAADPIALLFSPISTSLVCDGVNYPGCSPGGSCFDPCCYCECRANGGGPGNCSLECCRNL